MIIDASRFPRIVLIALPAVLVLLAQTRISSNAFQALAVVTALVTAFVPIARGGIFPYLKYAVMNDQAIPRSMMTVIVVSIVFSSIGLTVILANNDIVTNGVRFSLSICVVLIIFFFLYFIMNLLAEVYFYAAGATKNDAFLALLLGVLVSVIFLASFSSGSWVEPLSKHLSQLGALTVLAPVCIRFIGKNIRTSSESLTDSARAVSVALMIAVIVSCLSILTRSQLINSESGNQGVLLANCLMSFGLLKLLLFREIRKLEKLYINSSFEMFKESGVTALLSLFILACGELFTWVLSGIPPSTIPIYSHLVAMVFVLSILFCGVVSSKLLRLFKLRLIQVVALLVACVFATVIVWLLPLLSLPMVVLIYLAASRYLHAN